MLSRQAINQTSFGLQESPDQENQPLPTNQVKSYINKLNGITPLMEIKSGLVSTVSSASQKQTDKWLKKSLDKSFSLLSMLTRLRRSLSKETTKGFIRKQRQEMGLRL